MNHKEVIDWINRNRRKTPHWTDGLPWWVVAGVIAVTVIVAFLLALLVTGLLMILGFNLIVI